MSALIEIQDGSDSVTVTIHDDGRTVTELMNELMNKVRPRCCEGKDIVINLQYVTYLAPHIIGVLEVIRRNLEEKGAHLSLSNAVEVTAERLRSYPRLTSVLVNSSFISHLVKD